MNTKTQTLFLALAFVALIALAVFAYNALSENIIPQNIGITPAEGEGSNPSEEAEKTAAPDFTVFDADGAAVKLSDLFGRPIVLNFWASWCPPCRGEMPDFHAVYQEIGEEVTFMMVDLVDGRRETKESGEKYIAEQGFTFPVYFDLEQDAARIYGITSIPTTILIDPEGNIAAGVRGPIDAETLRKGLKDLFGLEKK
ncbi:MAG: TlpA disulfide reductase family protein [Clostridia bacterium]|jgi:thiol-disulfide isomerase/thioredoxin|nr:TlpA disulfide reductase family protein [Clostridia bacterium]